MEYASVIWNPQSKIKMSKLDRVQQKFVKFHCYKLNIEYDSTNYEEICKAIGIEP